MRGARGVWVQGVRGVRGARAQGCKDLGAPISRQDKGTIHGNEGFKTKV